ncbi:WD40 repeat-containing protein [Synechococcus sp. PCC 7502]|uniref:WD40 domain-containing protein n=1 Tax=Synechococcus sp. PCC 7502 TaxID=1173263 RepID=UPI00029FCF7D|nr:adenylate/guanylate cyclase domain-containing protein [Synechococcus sp. PCC 7502]AFY73517.1 WD40 repeat-containing protein [Synechococcus sp. PCC 7502]
MSNSLKASLEGLEIINRARLRHGWTKTRSAAWWMKADVSQITLRRFWSGEKVRRDNFIAICDAVGIKDWQAIAVPVEELIAEIYESTISAKVSMAKEISLTETKRNLAAIVFTDIQGFTAHLENHEEQALTAIARDFQMMTDICQSFEGQVLKSTGDGLLLYFTSAIAAVACALEIQESLVKFSETISDSISELILAHRIGIHLGDVFFSDGDVMGNGVNIASRIQNEAEPGGICISQTVYDVVKHTLSLKANYLGARELKNISEAVPIYEILLVSQEARARNREQVKLSTTKLRADIKQVFHQSQDWGEAPDVSDFYGRDREISQLESWIINDRHKLIAILGMGGIGKTTIAVAVADQVSTHFDCLIWRSLRNAPPVDQLLSDLLLSLSTEQLNETEGFDQKLSRVTRYIQDRRCLLVLDNLESILSEDERGRYRSGYEGYAELVRCFAETRHQGCLVFTGREPPLELSRFNSARSLLLSGVSDADGKRICNQIAALDASEREWHQIITHYGGNPLALKIVVAGIRDLLGGDVRQFLELLSQGILGFRDIQDVLSRQFDRISIYEREAMYWLAIAREPISFKELHEDLVSLGSRQKLLDTLESLQRRSLLETSHNCFNLQPVVMEYVTNYLVEEVSQELSQGFKAWVLFRSHALIKASAPDYIREIQVRFILNPIIDRIGNDYLGELLLQLKAGSKKDYAAGNLLNLLVQAGTDLTNYDFSDLTIWQAYLRDVNLHSTNFRNSNLTQSTFRETFLNIISLLFSANGEFLATGDSHGQIGLWQVSNGKRILEIDGHTDIVFALALATDGKYLVSGSLDQTVKLWNLQTGNCESTLLDQTGGISMLVLSPDNHYLACSCGDRYIRVLDLLERRVIHTLSGHTNIPRAIAFDPHRPILASCGLDSTIRVWDLKTGVCLQVIADESELYTLAFSADGKLLATGGENGVIKFWSTHTWTCLNTLTGHSDRLWSISFSLDGRFLASAGDDLSVRIWDVETGVCLRNWLAHQSRIWSLAFSPNSLILASGSEDKSIKFWHPETGHCLRKLQGCSNEISPFAFKGNNLYLLSGVDGQNIQVWNINTGKCEKRIPTHNAFQASLSPDCRLLASASLDNLIRIFAVETGNLIKTLTGHTIWVRETVFNPNGDLVASASGDKTAKLWDVQTGQCLHTLIGHSAPLQAIAFSPNGNILATGAWDAAIGIWDAQSGECLRMLRGHNDRIAVVSFHPNSNILASGSRDSTIRLWNIHTGECILIVPHLSVKLHALAIHPSGNILASSGLDTAVRLWDVQTGKLLHSLDCSTKIKWIWSVVFSEDGRLLATGSEDGLCQIWDVNTATCIQTIKISRPYEGMNIYGVRGVTEAQISVLRELGAIEDYFKG